MTIEPVAGHGKPCHSCGVTCNGFAGNPSLWPLCLPVEGMPTWFCTGCIASLRDENERLNRELEEEQKNGSDWFNAFQKISEWLGHRDWYMEADIHPTDPSETLVIALERKEAELEKAAALLEGRDKFIVDQGLWQTFVDQLPLRDWVKG